MLFYFNPTLTHPVVDSSPINPIKKKDLGWEALTSREVEVEGLLLYNTPWVKVRIF